MFMSIAILWNTSLGPNRTTKKLSAIQNASFFKFEYLQNRYIVLDDFLYDDVIL